jgi:hypothetical protein
MKGAQVSKPVFFQTYSNGSRKLQVGKPVPYWPNEKLLVRVLKVQQERDAVQLEQTIEWYFEENLD